MNILVINDYWKPLTNGVVLGGTENCVVYMAEALQDLGHKVFISTSADSDDTFSLDGSKTTPLLKWIEFSKMCKVENDLGRMNTRTKIIPSIKEQIKDNNIDYVMLNQTNPNIIRTIADFCRDNNINHSVHIHSDIYNWGMMGMGIMDQLENITEAGTNTVAVSKYHKRRLTRNEAVPSIKSVCRHFYVDEITVNTAKDSHKICSASRLDKTKNTHKVLEKIPDSMNITLMGEISRLTDKDIAYAGLLKPLLEKPNVHYLGTVSKNTVFNHMSEAKYVYDGDYDSPGSIQSIEALSHGCYFVRPKIYDDAVTEFFDELGLLYRTITIDQMISGEVPDLSIEQITEENKIITSKFGRIAFNKFLIDLIKG